MIAPQQSFQRMGQFQALLTKNWILYKRSLCGNFVEILIPVCFVMFIMSVSELSPPTLYTEQSYIANAQYSQTIDDITSLSLLKQCQPTDVIALAPSSSNLITQLNTILTANSKTTHLFSSESMMEAFIRSRSYSSSPQICWGVIVQSQTGNSYSYKLRFNISSTGPNDGPIPILPLTQDAGLDFNSYSSALNNGMIGASNLVNDVILQIESASTTNHLRQYVSPAYQEEYTDNPIYANLSQSVATLFLLPLLIVYLRQSYTMLGEKESKVRESMRIMGMKMRNYYLTWFLRYFLVYFIIHLFASAIFSNTLPNVPYYIPLIIFLLFDIVLIVQSFFIQVFISRAKMGIVISLLFFVIQFLIVFMMDPNPTESSKNTASISPHMALVLALQNLLYFESKQIEASFTRTINNYNLGTTLASFSINIVVYLVLLWYLDQVIPSQWGAKRHPLFCCFEKRFTKPVQTQQYSDRRINGMEEVDKNFKMMEKSNEIIEIAGLKKQFNGGDLLAVDGLNLNIYKNQIFALLGHNGAGKTTTISMLTGLIEPTEGFISMFGETEMDSIRSMLGVCPQHDTLYDDLTVEEHLYLYATFKGLEEDVREAEVNKLIRDVNLGEKRDEYAKNLSGGQKRRLSVAIAFAGKSKVIILDEPTSGMDTSSRRYIWDLLKTYKNDRIIILTTHFMDEADFLGDRIGIMGSGKLLCCGSSIFLKNRFGIGYNITFVKKNSQINSYNIVKVVQKIINDATVLSDVSSELSMQLPLSQIKKFSHLFREIDSLKDQLMINEYGISITTLQEVFLRVANETAMQIQAMNKVSPTDEHFRSVEENSTINNLESIKKRCQDKLRHQLSDQLKEIEVPRYQSASTRFFIHFKATFIKRIRIIKRDVKTFLFQLLLPFMIALAALLLMTVSYSSDYPGQTINLKTYLSEQNPVAMPIGSANTILSTNLGNSLSTKYGSSISVSIDTADTTPSTFDYNYLYPRKRSQATLKGGIYFLDSAVEGSNTVYPFYSLCMTRSPTSYFFLSSLASQTIINNQFGKNIEITLTNHPLPLTFNQLSIGTAISGFVGAFIFSLALSFKFSSIISFIVKEREDRVKHQQIVSGMKISSYWLANFCYDYLLYLVIALPTAALCKAFAISTLTSGNAFGATFLLFISYGLAYIPFTYIVAFIYKSYGSAQSYYFFLTYLVGGMLPIITFVLRIISPSSVIIGKLLGWVLRVDPAFAFGEGILNIGSTNLYELVENKRITTMDLDIALGPIIYLFGGFIVYFFLLFLIQTISSSESMMRRLSSECVIEDSIQITESDVLEEYGKAMKADPEDYEILSQELRKVFLLEGKKKHKVAVDRLTFGVKKGEVFGLLGVNGAGKSTTFKMLSGEITSTSGDSYFCGLKISENLDRVRQSLGYCPQFDALVETLTVREQIELYYDLKSLEAEFKPAIVTQIMKQLDLLEYEDKISGTLSGGNKRKLSVAIAMIGNPKIVFLDEPSTGMDPKARRFMWKVISKIATERKQSTIILTTHSMEEAEALSTRLAIMVKGNFQCIGTPQHIKSKYGEGMEVELKLDPISRERIEAVVHQKKLSNNMLVSQEKLTQILDILGAKAEERVQISENGNASHIFQILAREKQVELELLIEYLEISYVIGRVKDTIEKAFGRIEIIETLQTFLKIKVVKQPNIGRLFQFFEESKERFGIQQYTIKQASVEQIFNRFAEIGEESSNRG